jgi:hypothetical protein
MNIRDNDGGKLADFYWGLCHEPDCEGEEPGGECYCGLTALASGRRWISKHVPANWKPEDHYLDADGVWRKKDRDEN